MTLWLGQDGIDHAFQGDYGRMWDDTVAAIAEVADHDPGLNVSIEYKPNEPRAFALLPDLATLLALDEVARPNSGVNLDFAHLLYAGEIPARSAWLAVRRSRLLGIHLNGGYGKRDDGLMVGSVHPVQTVELFVKLFVELFVELLAQGHQGAIYFDTFPDHSGLDPVAQASANSAMTLHLMAVAQRLAADPAVAAALYRPPDP